ncbi:alpha-amylase [Schaedlerella arabinosiphila]|uniref:Alpha-amylase n=1 Tax=Schaedlerella arabinosiphila TaxID=2044587 RepID=A0A9X5H8M3_9FIRM|nr:alpha-amylase family glycosyl hydrolase [Schaedlerella arabinosiphila]KAI4443973.1 1,4-alpha-glucan branching enzyme GlgB [Schaedlerella arabinosiphila]NDO71408.1 alpha-amylase [Schaedlerella arabinosiphila]
MAWYDEAVFYHIYPLGLTGAPKENPYGEPEHRLNTLLPWIAHIREIGCNALYIGPLFESVGHGYETTDYKKLDSRLGTNEDLTGFVAECHRQGIKVILDGVFNHTGRDFFAFQDIKKNRENSAYKDWYCNVNFWGNNSFNDGFSYENWGGYDLLVKLNQHNPAVKDYICDVIRFWVSEFDIDGIRLDAADVLDFNYMQALRHTANEVKPDFWLMGEVIHGDYTRWVNEGTLHSVTNYNLHKALYSGHNEHNYFEIAHTVKRLYGMGGNRPDGLKLYNFVDNHDVERIYTRLNNKAHFTPVHILLYTLPGVPSVYYGSEFGIEGRKERFSDDSLRPALNLSDYADAAKDNSFTRLIAALGRTRQNTPALSYGEYNELLLTNRQYAFSRNYNGQSVVVTVNNDDSDYTMTVSAGNAAEYIGVLSGEKVSVNGGRITVNVKANSGEIWIPAAKDGAKAAADAGFTGLDVNDAAGEVSSAGKKAEEASGKNAAEAAGRDAVSEKAPAENTPEHGAQKKAENQAESVKKADEAAQGNGPIGKEAAESTPEKKTGDQASDEKASASAGGNVSGADAAYDEAFEKGKIAGLQEAILAIMGKNGPITDQMRRDVTDNVYHDSLINWIKSFR